MNLHEIDIQLKLSTISEIQYLKFSSISLSVTRLAKLKSVSSSHQLMYPYELCGFLLHYAQSSLTISERQSDEEATTCTRLLNTHVPKSNVCMQMFYFFSMAL